MLSKGIRYADGVPCCCSFDADHNPIPSNPAHHCKACQEYFGAMARFPAPATLEGRRHSAEDQAHLDAAGSHAAAVLDKLHSAGARVPGTSQTAEADLETEERDAAAPDPYAPGLAKMRAAAATPESIAEDAWKAERLAALTATRTALDTDTRLATLSSEERAKYAPPDGYALAIKAMQEAR